MTALIESEIETDNKSELRRQKILRAALYCFQRFGYSRLTLNDVAREAGITRTLIYHSFRNKEHLFLELFEGIFDEQHKRIELIVRADMTTRGKLIEVFEILLIEVWSDFTLAGDHEDLMDAVNNLFPKIGARFREAYSQLLGPLVGGPDHAMVLILAMKGMPYDRPDTAKFRNRIALLADHFR